MPQPLIFMIVFMQTDFQPNLNGLRVRLVFITVQGSIMKNGVTYMQRLLTEAHCRGWLYSINSVTAVSRVLQYWAISSHQQDDLEKCRM